MPIKQIVRNKEKLAISSLPVMDHTDISETITDMLDTAKYHARHQTGCLGLACNQIGVLKRVIVVFISGGWIVLINPEFEPVYKAGRSSGKEGCLSRPGVRTFRKRYRKIDVTYQNEKYETKTIRLSRLSARIVQHEVDHLNGITI